MGQMRRNENSFTLSVDGSLFAVGFVIGTIVGKLVLRSTALAVAFGTGLGLAVGTSPRMQELKSQNGR